MTTTGLLDLGAAEVVDRNTGELLGYVFTVPSGAGQLQRWLLFRNPKNELEIRPPPAAMAQWSLDVWQKHVVGMWKPNGYYVWAQADVYKYDGIYGGVKWRAIPTASHLPTASFPERPGGSYQLDYLDGKVFDVRQNEIVGRAYVVRGISDESSIEYWSLPARYQPAGKVHAAVSVGTETAASLDGFVEQCQASWSVDATFIITGCLNYHGSAAPFAP